MTFEIQYTDGLTVSIAVTSNPGSGASWASGYPRINWGDGATTIASSGTHSHTYPNYSAYTISYIAMNNCNALCTDSKNISLVEPCPTPTCIATVTQSHDTLHLDMSASNAGAGETIYIYQWTIYEDGTYIGKKFNAIVDYVMPHPDKNYTIYAIVQNSCGNDSNEVTKGPYSWTCPTPTCIATVTQTGDTLSLDMSASNAGAGETISDYQWAISPASSPIEWLTGSVVEYIMAQPGETYTIGAAVTNSCGLTDYAESQTFSWTCPVPTCGFTIN